MTPSEEQVSAQPAANAHTRSPLGTLPMLGPLRLLMLLCVACCAAAFSSGFFNPNGQLGLRVSARRTISCLPLRSRQNTLKSRGTMIQCSSVSSDEPLKRVPVVDFQGFVSGSSQEKERVAMQIFNAFRDIGFVTLQNHGLEPEVLKQTFRSSRDFFELPDDAKQKYKYRGAESNRGYLRLGHEKLADGLSDIKETFEIGNEAETDFPNAWPDEELPAFKGAMLECFNGLDSVHLNIMRCIAMGLKLDPEYFTPLCNENHQNLRLLKYPSCKRDLVKQEGQKRAGTHTDYGTITLVLQEDIGGLQACCRDGTWIDVKPVPNAIVINVGDCLMRWSNDVLVSTPHRVVADPAITSDILPDRFSVAFFCNPNKSALVECLPRCSTPSSPPRYAPINAFDYLCGRLSDTISR